MSISTNALCHTKYVVVYNTCLVGVCHSLPSYVMWAHGLDKQPCGCMCGPCNIFYTPTPNPCIWNCFGEC